MKFSIQFILSSFFVFSLLHGCGLRPAKLNSECQKFEDFIKSVWKYNSATSTYFFKDNPEWWYDTKYFNETCLMGRNKKEITQLFGSPSKEFKFINKEYITYCLEESCLFSVKSNGIQIGFFFDSIGIVNHLMTSPPMQKRKGEF